MTRSADLDLDVFEKSLGNQDTEKERSELKNKFILIRKMYQTAEQKGYIKSVMIEEQEKIQTHCFFPLNEGVGNQYNTFNSFFGNIDSIERTKTDMILLDNKCNRYVFKVESILLHYLWSYAHNVELSFHIIGEILDFDKLWKSSKLRTGRCKCSKNRDSIKLAAGDKLDLLCEYFGEDAKKLFDFDISLRNSIQHFNFSFYSDKTGIYILYGSKKKRLDLTKLFLLNKNSNLILTAILRFFIMRLTKSKNLKEATYLKIIVESCNRLY